MLVAMGVITYFIPYLFLFASAIRLQRQPRPGEAFRLAGGKRTIIPLACLGFLSTACTIVLSLFPAEDDAHPTATLVKIVVGTVVLLGVGIAVYRSGRRIQVNEIAAG
jgi:amino acid transporter